MKTAETLTYLAMVGSFLLLIKMYIDGKKVSAIHVECEWMMDNLIKLGHGAGVSNDMSIKRIAELELQREGIRAQIDLMKLKLNNKKSWHKFVPFTIVRRKL